jgi:hypothetical protein
MRRFFLLPVLLLLLASCGGPYKVAPVSGRITLNGNPLDHASLTFQPVAAEGKIDPGPGSGAFTDAEGRYTLVLVGKETKGAVVGKHKVRIYLTPEANVVDKAKKRIMDLPEKYNAKTTLEYDVPTGGTTSADFDLTVP